MCQSRISPPAAMLLFLYIHLTPSSSILLPLRVRSSSSLMHLPEVLLLVGNYHEQGELYVALKSQLRRWSPSWTGNDVSNQDWLIVQKNQTGMRGSTKQKMLYFMLVTSHAATKGGGLSFERVSAAETHIIILINILISDWVICFLHYFHLSEYTKILLALWCDHKR